MKLRYHNGYRNGTYTTGDVLREFVNRFNASEPTDLIRTVDFKPFYNDVLAIDIAKDPLSSNSRYGHIENLNLINSVFDTKQLILDVGLSSILKDRKDIKMLRISIVPAGTGHYDKSNVFILKEIKRWCLIIES